MPRPVQLLLDLPHAASLDGADFLDAPCNAAALAHLRLWPDWPARVVRLEGSEGCGKTHLAHIWARRSRAVWIDAPGLAEGDDPLARLGPARAAVIEDADRGGNERAVLHLYNLVSERRGHLLLTLRRPPGGGWPRLPDLASRLHAAHRLAIRPPDDALLASLLVKQLADRQLRVDAGVVTWLLHHMERSFAAVSRIVRDLDAASLRAGRPITLATARAVLAEQAEQADRAMLSPSSEN
jgi:chromosomal replication initiation ATPase DnaA